MASSRSRFSLLTTERPAENDAAAAAAAAFGLRVNLRGASSSEEDMVAAAQSMLGGCPKKIQKLGMLRNVGENPEKAAARSAAPAALIPLLPKSLPIWNLDVVSVVRLVLAARL